MCFLVLLHLDSSQLLDVYMYFLFFLSFVGAMVNPGHKLWVLKEKKKPKRELEDPLVVFGWDVMLMILNHLDARSLALSLMVSRSWHGVASSDDAIWAKKSRILKEDLWDHSWEFHFKKSAPGYWLNLDPYWKGTRPLMRRYFHPDGSQTTDPDDKVWGGHECCYTIVTSLLGDGKIREHYVRISRWPQMSISRKRDWGWKMSNHL
ncbi:putative F-box-like domain superfamily protein [Helianthus anomalus]